MRTSRGNTMTSPYGRRDVASVAAVLLLWHAAIGQAARAADVTPRVEVEEDVYSFNDARNGAGPMWCAGSTTLVRSGGRLFASGLETIPDAKPLTNCRWFLLSRDEAGWRRVRVDAEGRTREPSPLAAFPDGRVFLSVNPTLGKGPEPDGGPARPDVLEFRADHPEASPVSLTPTWRGSPAFSEHSYRTFVADGAAGELLLMQNIGYKHAEWTLRDRSGEWSARGQILWPSPVAVAGPTPLRLCYPTVQLKDRAVHFLGVGDVLEPNPAYRTFKRGLTGRDWDYVFCRLFYTWTPDITGRPFADWIEIANLDETRGQVWPCDLSVAPDGGVHILWTERAIDERLRAKFFPAAKQSVSLNHGVIRDGKLLDRREIARDESEASGLSGLRHRFHVTPDHRLFVVYGIEPFGADTRRLLENRLAEILPDGRIGGTVKIPLARPFADFFTATVRAGSPASWTLDMLGTRPGAPDTIGYARINLARPGNATGRAPIRGS
ncbi:hypothetical protein OJF2_18320 [Aquisphaera giovannonii]|uniref:Uncharacterized protein n=1 Tax=Aquisphaera giovannonii TaxID=406548 RepID=A0A5B9VZD0_9BACT|nr:hypothetical protein [Aquisphaera giovannonii]QEH33331.1 hypothetical protein OJF2_18320 [Aquisphaera giovannonii]